MGADESDDVFDIPAKKANPEALRRWRQATLVLNAARRFRYTAKLREENSKVVVVSESTRKFRKTGHAVVAMHRFKEAGLRAKDTKLQTEEFISGNFGVSVEALTELNEDCSVERLQTFGGVPGLAKKLRTDLELGLSGSEEDLSERRRHFGENRYPEKAPKPFLEFLWEACQDTTLIILMVCAVVVLVAGMVQHLADGWYEGVGIAAAVILVILVTAVSDYRQSLRFRDLNAEKANIQLKVVRNGRRLTMSIYQLVVGDLIPLAIGDQVPGDGIVVSAHSLTIDESSMTGESHPIHKDHKNPFLLSGCKVADGYGTMMVTGVGTHTEWGRVMATLSQDNAAETPLQVRLNGLATTIGKIGLLVAVLVLLILLVRYFVGYESKKVSQVVSDIVKKVAIAMTIVVVAVPEGLPLAVTITLAYSMRKMMMDKAMVRKLAACETMGSATAICSDKTGTLTMNQMVVVKMWVGGALLDSVENMRLSPVAKEILLEGVAQNSNGSVFIPEDGGPPEVTGSPTESAILTWGILMGMDFATTRRNSEIIQVEAFNSSKKRAGVVVKVPSGEMRAHWKGAAEIVLENCTRFSLDSGTSEFISPEKRKELEAAIFDMAEGSLRCIAIAYRPITAQEIPSQEELEEETWKFPEDNLILAAIVGIKDPCRPGVPEAVARCQQAGVRVRMVTGDNPLTAKAIARECGILTPDGIIMEGKEFRVLTHEQMLEVIPRIDVLARSSPTDKLTIVKKLREMGEVVAVTGDGTNDAPALHEADIGLAMGIAGTEVAKESSDIIILDDNFTSIVKVVRWGRSVYANLQKFLQFQLTVNVTALVTNFVAACSSSDVPLTAVQLLWVNLIMDTLGALALATESPTDDLLNRPPIGRRKPLVTNIMWRNVIFMAIYQLIFTLTFNYAGKSIFNLTGEDADSVNRTIIFNAFVFSQLFNEINSRKPDRMNVFSGLFTNPIFMTVVALSAVFQVIIVEFLNDFASTTKLTWQQWLICIGIGSIALPWGAVIKLIPVPEKPFSDFFPHIRLRRKKRPSSPVLENDIEMEESSPLRSGRENGGV